jgi:hypothetical protein
MNKFGLTVVKGAATGICNWCGARVGWYRINGVDVRICEHKDPKTGKLCANSKRPLTG